MRLIYSTCTAAMAGLRTLSLSRNRLSVCASPEQTFIADDCRHYVHCLYVDTFSPCLCPHPGQTEAHCTDERPGCHFSLASQDFVCMHSQIRTKLCSYRLCTVESRDSGHCLGRHAVTQACGHRQAILCRPPVLGGCRVCCPRDL